jgi:hypothetical protein
MSAVQISGQTVLFDEADLPIVKGKKWFIGKEGYAQFKDNDGSIVSMHLLFFRPERGLLVDHRDRNKLNNQRCNFRIATRSQNAQNAAGKTKLDKTSVFKGVYWYKARERWRALLRLAGKRLHLGYFADEADAAKAYNRAAVRYFGEFANLNQI